MTTRIRFVTLLVIGGALACGAGCAPVTAAPAQSAGGGQAAIGESTRQSAPPEQDAPPELEGVHAERLTLRSDDPHRIAKVVEDVLGLHRRRTPDADVRSVFVESRTNELVVVGTDRGIARVRALLSPGLIADPQTGDEPFADAAAALSPPLTAVGSSEP
jgi:hypothetical protein